VNAYQQSYFFQDWRYKEMHRPSISPGGFMNKLIILGAFAAGLVGGLASRFILPEPVQAQSTAPKQIRAQSFVVEDASGRIVGIFSANPVNPVGPTASPASIRLLDLDGNEVWRAGGRQLRPLAQK
jgi:hypothetical protein